MLSPAVRYYLRLTMVPLALFSLLRVIFFFTFKNDAPLNNKELFWAFWIGLRFDIRVIFLLALPNLVFGLWRPLSLRWSNFGRKFWSAYWIFFVTFIFTFYIFDMIYYSYVGSRLNATALRFLEDLSISLLMIWQTYPVLRGFFGVFVLGWIFKLIFNYYIITPIKSNVENVSFEKSLLNSTLLPVIILLGIWGKISQYPLRWSDAYFSNHSLISSLAVNPIHYFFDTLKYRNTQFSPAKTQEYFPFVKKYLGIQELKPLNFARAQSAEERPGPPLNVVIIVLESTAAFKTGLFGNPLDPTPYLDSIAKKGVLFTNHFVPSEATARSIFGLLTGIPDVNSENTSSRNPLIASQNLIVNYFNDYEKFYFIGGSASWGNIRGLLSYNIPGLEIIEEGKFKSERADVWGISDLSLFKEANGRLKNIRDKPFFAVIQTAGFHRPYTIPDDHLKFELKNLDDKKIKNAGFISLEEYNSLRFQDYSLGHFFEIAAKEDYFKNTLFVITGDHGLPDNAAKHLKKGEIYFGLTRWHVPLVFYSKRLFSEPKVIPDFASELDIMATTASLAGIGFTNTTLGRNLFSALPPMPYAFLFTYYDNPPGVGLLDSQYYLKCNAQMCHGLFDYTSDTPEKDLSLELPDKAKEMQNYALGIYESAKYLLYHNPNPLVK